MQRLSKALKGQRGDYLASSMVGAFISLLVLGVVAAGIMGTSAFQAQLAVRSAITNQASLTDSALRTDLIWASQIEARDENGFTATVPGSDGGCRVSEWNIRDSAEGGREIVNTVYSYESFNPDTNPVSCSGGSTGRIESVMVTEASPGSAFTYRNTGGYGLTYRNGLQEARAHDLASKPDSVSTVNWKSTKLDTVVLDTVVGYGSDTATPFRFSQTASNLDVVSDSPDGRPNFQEKGLLTAVKVGTLSFNYAGSTTFDSNARSQYLSPTATGGTAPYKYSISGGTLPGGVTFNPDTGSFKGPVSWQPQVTATGSGYDSACALASKKLYCWGSGPRSGNGASADVTEPTPVEGLTGRNITAVSSGHSHTCAIADEDLYCWGSAEDGRIGNGSEAGTVEQPTKVMGELAGKTVTSVSAGLRNTCAVADEKAYCWGEGKYGALGNGTTENATRPVPVNAAGVIGGAPVTAVTAGRQSHACAVADGQAFCWGGVGDDASKGALGSGKPEGSSVPVQVSLPGKTFTEIGAGAGTTCAVASGAVYCWGSNQDGRAGNGSASSTDPVLSPAPVKTEGTPLAGQKVQGLTVGQTHSCVIAGEGSGSVSCWGSGAQGQMGTGASAGSNPAPQPFAGGLLAGQPVSAVTAGWDNTCAVTDGAVYCWGAGRGYVLGNGTTDNSATPVAAGALSGNAGYPLTRTVSVTDAAGKKVTGSVTLWLE